MDEIESKFSLFVEICKGKGDPGYDSLVACLNAGIAAARQLPNVSLSEPSRWDQPSSSSSSSSSVKDNDSNTNTNNNNNINCTDSDGSSRPPVRTGRTASWTNEDESNNGSPSGARGRSRTMGAPLGSGAGIGGMKSNKVTTFALGTISEDGPPESNEVAASPSRIRSAGSGTGVESSGVCSSSGPSNTSEAIARRQRFMSAFDEADSASIVEAVVDNALRHSPESFVSLPREPFRRALGTAHGRTAFCSSVSDLCERQITLSLGAASNLALAMMEGFDASLTAADFISARQLVRRASTLMYSDATAATAEKNRRVVSKTSSFSSNASGDSGSSHQSSGLNSAGSSSSSNASTPDMGEFEGIADQGVSPSSLHRLTHLVGGHAIFRDDKFWGGSFRLAMIDHARRLSLAAERESLAAEASEMVVFGQLGCYVYDMSSAEVDKAVIVRFVEERCKEYNISESHRKMLLTVADSGSNATDAELDQLIGRHEHVDAVVPLSSTTSSSMVDSLGSTTGSSAGVASSTTTTTTTTSSSSSSTATSASTISSSTATIATSAPEASALSSSSAGLASTTDSGSMGAAATSSSSSASLPSSSKSSSKKKDSKKKSAAPVLGELKIRLIGARSLIQRCCAYCVFKIKFPDDDSKTPSSLTYKSRTAAPKSTDPTWDETIIFEITDHNAILQAKLWEDRLAGRGFLGMANCRIDTLLDGFPRNEWHHLEPLKPTAGKGGKSKPGKEDVSGAVRLELQYETMERRPCGLPRGTVIVKVVRGRNLVARDRTGLSDPFAVVTVGNERQRTKHIAQTLDPEWGEEFLFQVLPSYSVVRCSVWDWDKVGASEFMGHAHVDLRELSDEMPFLDWVPLGMRSSRGGGSSAKERVTGDVLIEAQYFPHELGGTHRIAGNSLETFFPTIDHFLRSKVASHYFGNFLESDELELLKELERVGCISAGTEFDPEQERAYTEIVHGDTLKSAHDRFADSTLAADLLCDISQTPAAKGSRLVVQRILPNFRAMIGIKKALELFTVRIAKEFSEENLEFFLAVDAFKAMFDQDGHEPAATDAEAKKIYESFVHAGSEREINVESNLRSEVTTAIKSESGHIPKSVFDATQQEVMALMEKGPYSRFVGEAESVATLAGELRADEVARAILASFPTFESALAHKTARAHVRRYLHTRLEAKYLRFYDACQELSAEEPFNANHARQIYNKHIAGADADNIGIPADDKKRVLALLESTKPPRDLFRGAIAFVGDQLTDRYAEFCHSRIGLKLALACHLYP